MAQLAFDATYYLQQNPDVAVAISRGQFASAEQHYNTFGRFESRNPSAFFDTTFYLVSNPDVAAARINPFQHFLQFGAAEGRFATASADAALDTDNNNRANEFNETAYRAAYPDIDNAIKAGQFTSAYQHYVLFGQFEATRTVGVPAGGPFTNTGVAQGTGSTFTLTTAVDTLTGTSANDTFNADHTTLQATDVIDGGAGTKDVFNFTDAGTTGGALPAAQVRNVETINVRNVNGTAAVAATNEVATLTFGAVTGGSTTGGSVAVGDKTYTIAPSANVSGADLAAYFSQSANLPSGYTFVSLNGNQLVLRASTAGNVTDVAATYTAGTGGSPSGSNPGVAIVQGTNAVTSTGVVDTLSATNFVGATAFNSTNSTNGVTINDLTQGQSVGIVGNGTTNNGALTANYAASATAATVNVVGGTTGLNASVAVTGTGLTSATINSTGAANTLNSLSLASTVTTANIVAATNLTTGTVTANGLTTLNVSGTAAKVDVGQLTSAVTKVDASGLSQGGLTATLDAAITSFKGGQGSDVVTTAALTSTTAGIIDAGAGTDTLVVAGGTIATAAQGAQYVNFETLRVGASQDVSLVSGITGVEVSATGLATTVSGLSAAQAGNIKVLGAQTAGLTLTLANATGSSDVVSLTLANPTETAATKAAAGIAGLSVIGVETLNVQSASGDTSLTGTINSLSFASNGADKLSTINLTGDRSIDLSLTNVASAVTVNDSLSGSAALKVSAGASIAGSVINGTANADDITLASVTGNGVVTYNLGAGNDVVKSTAANLANHAIDFGAGTDTLSITNTTADASLVDATFQRITNLEKVSFASTTGNLSLTSGGFFDSNFKAAGIELSATALTTGGANINLASFTGNATVTTSATGVSTQSITTGSGNDIIKIGGDADSTLTVVSGAGNDTITITGAAGAIVTAGLGADTINAGAGADTFKFNYGDSVVSSFDTITGLNLGTSSTAVDKLSFQQASNTAATVVTLTAAQQTSVSGAANLSAAVNAVAAIATADGATTQFTYGTDTYIFHSGAATTAAGTPEAFNAATDHLVKVTGVTGTLDASDIAIYQ